MIVSGEAVGQPQRPARSPLGPGSRRRAGAARRRSPHRDGHRATELDLLVIGQREFAGAARRGAELAHKLLVNLAERVRELDEQRLRLTGSRDRCTAGADSVWSPGPRATFSGRMNRDTPATHPSWSSGSASPSPSSRCCRASAGSVFEDSQATTRRSRARSSGTSPTRLKLVFYTVIPVLLVYGAVLFAQRVQELGAGRARQPGHHRRRTSSAASSDFRAGVYMQTLLRDPAAGIMHSLIYFGVPVLLGRHHGPRDQPPAARERQVPPRRRLPGATSFVGDARRPGVPRRRRVGDRPPLRPAALPHPHQDQARARRDPRHVPRSSASPASSPRCSASPSTAGPTSRSGRSSATRCRALVDGIEQPRRLAPGLVDRPRRRASSPSW